jgi:hypothetical protein
VKVETKLKSEVPDLIAAQLIENFLEWAEDQGYELAPRGGGGPAVGDERSYDVLASDYVASVVDG